MNLSEYAEKHGRAELAEALQTSPAYVSQLASGHRRITAEMAIKIERATNGEVTRHELRPDLYPEEPKRRAGDRRAAA